MAEYQFPKLILFMNDEVKKALSNAGGEVEGNCPYCFGFVSTILPRLPEGRTIYYRLNHCSICKKDYATALHIEGGQYHISNISMIYFNEFSGEQGNIFFGAKKDI